jgi:hypothetical protein
MVMRYFGSAVGHKGTYEYMAAFRKDAREMVKQSTSATGKFAEEQVHDTSEEARFAEEDDYGYELGDEIPLDNESSDEDDNLGAEDGEEPWDLDDLHAEGFDEL